MEKEFVPYELAFKLVYDLGFKEKCLATIDHINYLHIKGTKSSSRGAMFYDTVDCPTFSQAFRWFREKYNLKSCIMFRTSMEDDKEYYDWLIKGQEVVYRHFKTYEEAELACLEKLIEIVELKSE
jgi:hypothetical protein